MRTLSFRLMMLSLAICLLAARPARAQWAVVDAPAIVQLVQEVATMEQQLATARNQLLQAQQALKTTTGDRGMQALLSGTVRNYLPADWPNFMSAAAGGTGSLSTQVQSAIAGNAVLGVQQINSLSPAVQQMIQATRRSNALRQAVAQQALANASSRFAALQSLIGAIPTASDQKGILDLQARISVELGMLQNEQTKLAMFKQASDAQDAALQQQAQEQLIVAHGSFASRFQPRP